MGYKERLEGELRASVSGDKYESILYCLHSDEKRKSHGLLDTLQPSQDDIKLQFIHAGRNDLHPRRGLSDASVQVLPLVLETISS